MSDLEKLIAMFPIVFMIHDFEEIMGFESWLKNNREELKQRFPKVENFLSKKGMFQVSTSKFAFAVCIIFILVSLVSFISLYSGVYQWWFVAFSAFFVHLFVHITQWIVYRKYIPVIITSFLSLPYCVYTLQIVSERGIFSIGEMLFWAFLGTVLMIIVLLCVLSFVKRI